MTARLNILNSSLAKKEAALNSKLDEHFLSVKATNGQPVNDKRNGAATFAKWNKQNDSIHNQLESIEITKTAIEREESKIKSTNAIYDSMPKYLQYRIDSGELIQWRKFPRIMFVKGVEKARIYWDKQTNVCSHKFLNQATKEEFQIFKNVYNAIFAEQTMTKK